MSHPFPTQEIGSLPKFSWRVKPVRNQPLSDIDLVSATEWGKRLHVDGSNELLKLLSKREGFTEREKKRIIEFSLVYAIAMQETAGEEFNATPGLDLIWSGEQARTEMYETPVSNIGGFEFIGRVRSFDNKYWRVASARRRPEFKSNYHLEEFLFTKSKTERAIKLPVTDAITIMCWSDHNYYTRKWSASRLSPGRRSFSARREFTLDLALVIREVLREMIRNGADEIQLDIPAATQYQTVEDAKLVAEAFNETTRGLTASFSVHSCYPSRVGYALLFPYVLEMKKCKRFSFEYANRDTYSRGLTTDARRGFEDLKLFKEYGYGGELGVGVIHVHTDKLPSLGLVRDRILYAEKVTGLAPEKLFVNPDCGLRTRRHEVAYAMLGLVVAGAEGARKVHAA